MVAFMHVASRRTRLHPQLSAHLNFFGFFLAPSASRTGPELSQQPGNIPARLTARVYTCKMPGTTDDSNTPAATQDDKYEGDTIRPSTHKALRAQLEKIKKVLEASGGDEEEANAANKSLFEVVRECAPRGSPLTSFLDNRSHKTTARISLISHGGYSRHATRTPQDVWNVVDQKNSSKDHILILRDIDSDWCEALCARYPGSIDRRFLLEHILGLDLHLFPGSTYQAPYVSRSPLKERMDRARILETSLERMQLMRSLNDLELQTLSKTKGRYTRLDIDPTLIATRTRLEDSIVFPKEYDDTTDDLAEPGWQNFLAREENLMQEFLLAIAARIDSKIQKARGVHVNWWRAPQSEDHGYHAFDSHEEFRRTKTGWAKSNAFVSCCRLADDLCE